MIEDSKARRSAKTRGPRKIFCSRNRNFEMAKFRYFQDCEKWEIFVFFQYLRAIFRHRNDDFSSKISKRPEMSRNGSKFIWFLFRTIFHWFCEVFQYLFGNSGRETRIFTKSFPKLGSAQKWCEIHMISILYKISMNFIWFSKVYGFVGDNNCILQLFVLKFSINLAFTPPSAGLLRNLGLRCPFIKIVLGRGPATNDHSIGRSL